MQKRVTLSFINTQSSKIEVPLLVRSNLIADLWYEKLKQFLLIEEGYIETRWSGFHLQRRSLPILIE